MEQWVSGVMGVGWGCGPTLINKEAKGYGFDEGGPKGSTMVLWQPVAQGARHSGMKGEPRGGEFGSTPHSQGVQCVVGTGMKGSKGGKVGMIVALMALIAKRPRCRL